MTFSKIGLSAALLAVCLSAAGQSLPAAAAGLPTVPAIAGASASQAVPVDYWQHRHRGWGGGWGGGDGIGLGIIGGIIIGGALMANAVAEHRADDRAMHACARDFPDFNWHNGTFVDNYGHVRICPYLQ